MQQHQLRKLPQLYRLCAACTALLPVLPWQVYIIEANPRASRTVPFVAKAIGHPLAAYASLLMSGKKLADINFTEVGGRWEMGDGVIGWRAGWAGLGWQAAGCGSFYSAHSPFLRQRLPPATPLPACHALMPSPSLPLASCTPPFPPPVRFEYSGVCTEFASLLARTTDVPRLDNDSCLD